MLGRHCVKIRQPQRVDDFPERVQTSLAAQFRPVDRVIRRILKLLRKIDSLVREVVDLAVFGQPPDRSIAEQKLPDATPRAFSEENGPAAVTNVSHRAGWG